MSEKYLEITDLKDMLNKTRQLYSDRPAYKLRIEKCIYRVINHNQVRDMIDALGTKLIDMGLKGKRIAVIGENRFEWEIAYLSIVCGTGIVVPLDKSLPINELEELIERSEVEAIFFTGKRLDEIKQIKENGKNKLKYLISMEEKCDDKEIYTENNLIDEGFKLVENGNRDFIDAKINPEEMSVMLFTSGTTSKSKVVALCHRNLCSNLMDLGQILDVNEEDTILSVLPIHHVFECTVGFLFSLYKGAQTVFCDGVRHIVENLNEYHVSVMACVPGIYERIFSIIRKELEKQGKLDEILANEEKYKFASMETRREVFKEIHDMLGGRVKILISGAASLDRSVLEKYRLLGINLIQGYGLTETSPVVAMESNMNHRIGSVGKHVPSTEVKILNPNNEGIGELMCKGPIVMLGYFNDEKATNEAIEDGWFHTGDLARIDEDGYVFICGRKKSVIVLKNGKNIFPEEMENLVNRIDGVKESFVFGKSVSDDKDNIKINVKIVFDREVAMNVYNAQTDEDIYVAFKDKIKEVNQLMPKYKAIRGVMISEEPLIKTTTNKIKRQDNLNEIEKLKN